MLYVDGKTEQCCVVAWTAARGLKERNKSWESDIEVQWANQLAGINSTCSAKGR